jgi:hypothetical protein
MGGGLASGWPDQDVAESLDRAAEWSLVTGDAGDDE